MRRAGIEPSTSNARTHTHTHSLSLSLSVSVFVRSPFIRMAACDHYGLNAEQRRPLESLSVVEVGCGGGILSESLAAMGAKVTAIDAAEESIEVAREVRQNQLLCSFVRVGNRLPSPG